MRSVVFAVLVTGCVTRMPAQTTKPVTLRLDPHVRAESGTLDVVDVIRLGFWAKDRGVGALEHDAQVAHPIAMAFARAAELVLVDIPLAAEATVIPHEVFGHGARLRELGGRASYNFQLPPPYSFTPSTTHIQEPSTVITGDARAVFLQAGLVVESFEARTLLRESVASGRVDHIDSGLMMGIPIHELFEATLPWTSNDVRVWTTEQAGRYQVSAQTLQHRYLAAVAIATALNPTVLFSTYDLLWRFVVRGERSGPMPALRVGAARLWATTHVSPVPWGLEYELGVLGRIGHGPALELAPRWGAGPGGPSAGLALELLALRVSPTVVFAGGVDLWVQPDLQIDDSPVLLGARPSRDPGARAHADARWEHGLWFVGLRLGAKTKGLSGLQPIAASGEVVASIGLRLGRP